MIQLTDAQREGLIYDVTHGVPLWSLANRWMASVDELLELAGISREEHRRRSGLRLEACKRGLNSDEADREVVATVRGDQD